jgi:hypothetical protein
MVDVNKHIQLTIEKTTRTPGRDNFGKMLALTLETPLIAFPNSELTKLYSAATDVSTDFGSSSEIAKVATAIFSQEKKVTDFYVGLRSASVAKVQEVVFSGALGAAHTVTGTINGEAISVPFNTSDAQTLTDLCTAAALVEGVQSCSTGANLVEVTAVAEWNLTISLSVAGTPATTVTVNSSVKKVDLNFSGALAAGDVIDGFVEIGGVATAITSVPFNTSDAQTLTDLATELLTVTTVISAAVTGINKITVTGIADVPLELTGFVAVGGNAPTITVDKLVEPGRTISDDIADVIAENNKWYMLLSPTRNKGLALAGASTIEPLIKAALFTSNESDILTGSTTDIQSKLEDLAYARTAHLYYSDEALYSDASWASRCLALPPGSGIWAFKTLIGITTDALTVGQVTNIESKNGNHYTETADFGDTQPGTLANGDFLDFRRNLDYMYNEISLDMFQHLKSNEIIYFTQDGIDSCDAVLKGTLRRMVDEKILASYTTTKPDIADIDSNDKANRLLNKLEFTAVGSGAIQGIIIDGAVEV